LLPEHKKAGKKYDGSKGWTKRIGEGCKNVKSIIRQGKTGEKSVIGRNRNIGGVSGPT